MFSYCSTCFVEMPNVIVYVNCDTYLAINLQLFDLKDTDEFLFTIKNHNYIESPPVYLRRISKSEMNDKGEVLIKINPEASRKLKPGAFYNFTMVTNALDPIKPTSHKKLTADGKIILEYGAPNLLIPTPSGNITDEILNMRLEAADKLDETKPELEAENVRISLEGTDD